MTDMAAGPKRCCWCEDSRLVPFNEDYLACTNCGTLVSQVGLSPEQTQVSSDEQDYYGKEYWFSHQSDDFGLPDIHQRARQDLPERCLHWLHTLLAFKLPPARVLELGCSHGAFVALMRWAGYDASGLEVSPWVVDYAQKTFGVPMLLGSIEEQQLLNHTFDVVVLNDLLEHLADPLATLGRCVDLLKPDGILLLQTPDYPDDKTYAEMVFQRVPFLVYLDNKAVTVEHLYVFSKRAAERLCHRLGCGVVQFEPPMFAYDMFFAAGKRPLVRNTPEQVNRSLEASPSGRLVQALLHAGSEIKRIHALWQHDHDLAQKDLHALHHQIEAAYQANRDVVAWPSGCGRRRGGSGKSRLWSSAFSAKRVEHPFQRAGGVCEKGSDPLI
jgi:2-polyprenyl-3-methyl-5-hydroxy-6-metoxy-1,4-benzoquinol methylase